MACYSVTEDAPPSLLLSSAYAKESVDLNKVREAIVQVVESDAEKRGDGTSLAGTLIRLAWHASGTYSQADHSGGSNGARMRYDPEASWGANAGLDVARAALEPVKAKFPDLSYADLYTYAGVVAVEEANGPKVPFRLGRSDFSDGSTSPADGRYVVSPKGYRGGILLLTLLSVTHFSLSLTHTHTNTSFAAFSYCTLTVSPMPIWDRVYRRFNMYGIFFIAWVSMIKKLLRFWVHMRWDVVIPHDRDIGVPGRMLKRHSAMNIIVCCWKNDGVPKRRTMDNPGQDPINTKIRRDN